MARPGRAAALGLLLVVSGAGPLAAAPAAPVPLGLAPIPDEVLHGCRRAELEKALRRALPRAKRIRLLPGEDGARATLEILECARDEEQRGKLTSGGGPGPVKDGVVKGYGTERHVGLETDTLRFAAIRARLVSGERFFEVRSGPKSRTLSQAADTLRRAIDRALEERGAWLLGSEP